MWLNDQVLLFNIEIYQKLVFVGNCQKKHTIFHFDCLTRIEFLTWWRKLEKCHNKQHVALLFVLFKQNCFVIICSVCLYKQEKLYTHDIIVCINNYSRLGAMDLQIGEQTISPWACILKFYLYCCYFAGILSKHERIFNAF